MGSRGGKRIRVNVYQNITNQDMVLFCDELDKELSNNNVSGVRVWRRVYKTKPLRGQRPSNVVEDFNNFCLDRGYVKIWDANYGVKYWLEDKNLTKGKRLSSQA